MVLTGKRGWKRPLGRLGHRWEKTFKVDLQDIGLGCGLDWSCSGQVGQVAGFCEHGNEPSGVIKCRVFLD